MFVLGGGFAFGLVWRSTSKAEMIKVVKSTERNGEKGKKKHAKWNGKKEKKKEKIQRRFQTIERREKRE